MSIECVKIGTATLYHGEYIGRNSNANYSTPVRHGSKRRR